MNIAVRGVNHIFRWLINILLILFSLSCLFPLLWVMNSSLRTNASFMMNIFQPTANPQWQNYVVAMTARNMGRLFFNSSYLTMISVAVIIVMAFIVGYYLSRFDFPGRKPIYALFVSGLIVPTISLMIPVFMVFNMLDLLDKWYTLLLPYIAFNLPLSVILSENFIHTIPREVDESAQIDGANQFQLISRIIVPIAMPILSTIIILNMMTIWNEFPFALILLRNPNLTTISVGLQSFKSLYTMDYALYMAALVIATLPVVAVFSIFSKRIIQGMAVGAVKG